MPLSVVILAAGQGKRMRSARPKVLQPLAGRPLLAHVLETARALGPAAIHVVYGHQGEMLREAFPEADLAWAHQAEQLGTGHAVQQAMPAVPRDHTVLVLCGDVPLIRAETVAPLVEAAAAGLAVLTLRPGDPTGYGRILRNDRGHVTGIVEERDATDEERTIGEVNSGVIAARAGDLARWLDGLANDNAQGEYYLTDVVAAAAGEGVAVAGLEASDAGELLGVNDRAQLAEVEAHYRRRAAGRLMRDGATLADPARIDVRGQVTVGADCFIDVNVVLEGEVHLGDNVSIGPGCVIRNARLGSGSVVHAHTLIEDLDAGERCELGPFARVRPGAVFADRVKIGNFVEIKKSQIGPGSKVNHLTYVGDAEIGTGVNVGAGTVTCNYDGANKHRTVIGDRAFIGSGAMLVAPVEIGAGATIGAGSTIAKAAPPERLTVARAKQVTIEHWKRPVKK